jgi:hypothetical protein
MSYRDLCRALRVPWSSFSRWRGRIRQDTVLVKRPGPKKVAPFDPAVLETEIKSLNHGGKRSEGTTNLYRRYQDTLSRRDLARMVEQVRREVAVDHRNHLRRIEWLAPGVVWAMDVTEYDLDGVGKIHLHNTQDLGSRYKFPPLSGECPVGEEIAGYLSEKFGRFGPPLFLKRDNGGNLNHKSVNEVLSEFFVLPLNSPIYYAPYNGAIEESQRELKTCLREKLLAPCPQPEDFTSEERPVFSKLERREIYDIVRARVERILASMNQFGKSAREAAWRIAVEFYLQSRGFIKVHIPQKVSPNFTPILAP